MKVDFTKNWHEEGFNSALKDLKEKLELEK